MVSSHTPTNDQGIQTVVLTTQGSSTPRLPRFLKNLEIQKDCGSTTTGQKRVTGATFSGCIHGRESVLSAAGSHEFSALSDTQGSVAFPIAQVRKLSLSISLLAEIAGNTGEFHIFVEEKMMGRVWGWDLEAAFAEHFMPNGENDNCLVLIQLESSSIGI